MNQPDWEEQVLKRSNLEKIFLTNDFDDPLTGFDTNRYVPCLRTDDLVFHLGKPETRKRLAKATGDRGRRRRVAAQGDSQAVRAFHAHGRQGVRHLAAAGLHAGAGRLTTRCQRR